MPVYEYACKACGQHVEVSQSFKDEPLTECPHCAGPLRKVFNSIGISFKGSGFYRTDSRIAQRKEAESAAKGEKSDKSEKADAKSEKSDKSDAKADKSEKSSTAGGSSKADGAKSGVKPDVKSA